jgi:hypothetical protein
MQLGPRRLRCRNPYSHLKHGEEEVERGSERGGGKGKMGEIKLERKIVWKGERKRECGGQVRAAEEAVG